MFDAIREMDSQNFDRRATDWRQTVQLRPVPPKVFRPRLHSGIEQRVESVRFRIVSGYVRPLVRIAGQTTPRQIRAC